MTLDEKSDSYWKQSLSQKVYDALRLGKMEEPNTGKYVHTNKDGTYLCAGCKNKVFSSQDKIEDDSGYATFRVVVEDDTHTSFRRTYSTDGEEVTSVVCNTCGGRLGSVSEDTVRSARDLEQGNHQYIVHVSSHAITLKKSLAFSNYPIGYLLTIGVLVAGGAFIWPWAKSFFNIAQHANVNGQMHLWVGDEEVYATTYSLDAIDPEQQSLVLGTEAIFIVLSKKDNPSRLRLSDQPVLILWLDDAYTIVQIDEKNPSDVDHILRPPVGASFALVMHKGKLTTTSLREGMEVLVVNKADLL